MGEGVSPNAMDVEMESKVTEEDSESDVLLGNTSNNAPANEEDTTDGAPILGGGNENDNDSCTNNGTSTIPSSLSSPSTSKSIPSDNRNSVFSVDMNAIASAAGTVETGDLSASLNSANDIPDGRTAAAAAVAPMASSLMSTSTSTSISNNLYPNCGGNNDFSTNLGIASIDLDSTMQQQQQQQSHQQSHQQHNQQQYNQPSPSHVHQNSNVSVTPMNGPYHQHGNNHENFITTNSQQSFDELKVIAAAPMNVPNGERINEIASTLSTSGSNSGQSRSSSHNSGISSVIREDVTGNISSTAGGIGTTTGRINTGVGGTIAVQIPNIPQQQQLLHQQHQFQPQQNHAQPQHLSGLGSGETSPIFPNLPDSNHNQVQLNQQQQQINQPQQHQQQYNHLPKRQYSNDNMQLSHISSTTMSPMYVDPNQHHQQQMQQQKLNPSPTSTPAPTQSTAPLQPQLSTSNNPPQQTQPPASNINEITNAPETNFDSIIKSPKNKDDIVEKSPGERYLRFSEKLGSGAYKDVYRAYDTIEGIEVAWNAVTLTEIPKSQRQYIVNEVRLLEKLNHANIISFHGSWVNRELEQVIFVTEILSSGTLKSFIDKVQVIRWKIAKRWAKQILKGLEYLHSQDPPIVHRDLKCDNIFINGTSGDLRIGDLGLSTVINKGNEKKVLSVLGTPEFMAPELYNESYDQAVDIYAFGMCMLEIFTKEVPYGECSNPAQIYKKVTSGIEPESLNRIRSPYAREFIRLCLGTPDGQGGYNRPSAKELLVHPFLEKREDDESEVKVEPQLREVGIPEGPSLTESASPHHLAQREQSRQENKSDSEQSVPQLAVPTNNAMNNENHNTMIQDNHIVNGDVPDEFNGMPDRESNIKNVTVLMGRRQQNDHDENDQGNMISSQQNVPPQQQSSPPLVAQHAHIQIQPQPLQQNPVQNHQVQLVTQAHAAPASQAIQPQHSTLQPTHMTTTLPQESVGQVVNDIVDLVDFENPVMPYYVDDIMPLRLTLFVQNQEKQVEFDFHLVNDDPVAVAHEMVTELQLPKEAVLELSQKISSVARNARMRQDHYKKQQLAQQETQNLNLSQMEESNISFQQATAVQPSSDMKQQQQLNHVNQYEVADTNGESIQHIHRETKTNTIQQSHDHSQMNTTTSTTIAAPTNSSTKPEETDYQMKQSIGRSSDLQHENNSSRSMNAENDDDDDDDGDSTSNLSEIKKLKIDYENKVKRTNKIYQTRMDNLIRSKEEKEALHLKTVEKHEKERLAFEKRVKQAEKEQEERVQKLQKEFEEQKAKALQSKQVSAQDDIVATEEKPKNINKEAAISNRLRSGTNGTLSLEEGTKQSPSPTFSLDGNNNI